MDAQPDIPAALSVGQLALDFSGRVLRLEYGGVEVIRQIDCPIRDDAWRTVPTIDTSTRHAARDGTAVLVRTFRTEDGSFAGTLEVSAQAGAADAVVTLNLTLTPSRRVTVNRAGFIVLHPASVAGGAVAVSHPDGTCTEAVFPTLISAGQPAFEIAGLRHKLHGIEIAIEFSGETFEMEDQRNWTDASFKTYCRPLSCPRPFELAAGEAITQSLTVRLSGSPSVPAVAASGIMARLPELTLAHEPALCMGEEAATPPVDGILLRIDARAPDLNGPLEPPLTLEIVADTVKDIANIAVQCARAGLTPVRVVALPRAYLASHQPEGPWPTPRPADFIAPAREAFPDAEIGGGVLTNFTEFNRCPPDPAVIDFATFGTTAIVHAADDRSVRETLEAFPALFASARDLVGDLPLRLGLVSIGMRSNPYGSSVAPNADRRKIAMAMEDPRQSGAFAAAFALGAIAEAARAGVASLAPAMAAGPLAAGPALFELLAALNPLVGTAVRIEGGPGRLLTIGAGARTFAANLGAAPVDFAGRKLASMQVAI